MDDSNLCTGNTTYCAILTFTVIIFLVFITLFLHYVTRYFNPSTTARIAVSTTVLSVPSSLYRHALKSIPAVNYSISKPTNEIRESCAICLADFEEGEKIRVLPKCEHVFHVECVDKWFLRSLCCPVCRKRVVDQHILHSKLVSSSSDPSNQFSLSNNGNGGRNNNDGYNNNNHRSAGSVLLSICLGG